MESFPQPHSYMRPPPPPPPMADPHHLHQPPPPPTQLQRPLPPSVQGSWYSSQFQYHPSHSPSPPPPHPPPPPQQQWGLPPPGPSTHSDHFNAPVPYAAHANPPYPAHPYQSQYPPAQRPQMPPPQAYPNANQDWRNVNWASHSGWEYQAHSNGEDWGAKARAWAAARNAMENQQSVMQSNHPSQYLPTPDSHYQNSDQINMHSSSYQNYPIPAPTLDKQLLIHQPQPAAVSSVHPYYALDGNFSYATKDGSSSDAGATFRQQDGFMSPSVHKQEVPSSYTSIPGRQDSKEQQPTSSGGGGAMSADQTQFSCRNHSALASTDPCDQPLQFAPRFNHESNPKVLPGYPDLAEPARGIDSAAALPTLQSWKTPVAPSISFPSISPTFPSAAQLDPTITMPPLPEQPSPMMGIPPGPNFQSTVSSLSSPVGLGTGIPIHHATAFHGDVYGTPMNSERPKKAAVPNWLRDEIIKKKDMIASSGPDQLKEEIQSTDEEAVDKPVGKSDQADSKSIDSLRSTEEEEEDEDNEEAVRTAAINQEIKRVLTEVLLKVTSDLFDDIATRVLSEDDHSIEAKNDIHAPSQKLSSPPAASASKASEKVLIPVKNKEPKSEDVSERSSSGAAGNVLGLVNYASDDDADDEEIRSSITPKSDKNGNVMSSSNKQFTEGMNNALEKDNTPSESEKLNKKNLINSQSVAASRGTEDNHASWFVDMLDHRNGRKLDNNDVRPPYLTSPVEEEVDAITDHERAMDSFDDSRAKNFSRKVTDSRQQAPAELIREASKDDSREKDARKHDKHENRSSSARDSAEEVESVKAKENSKGEQHHGRHDERHHRKKNGHHNGSKERSKEQGVTSGEKTKEVDSRKQSYHQSKESIKEVERVKQASEKDNAHRKRERLKDDKGDRSKHKHASDSSRHKKRRSSVDNRERNSKDNSVASYSDNSTDEASESSRRKMHSKKRNLSPSPVRSSRRQVSRSPPSSKVSQRRHSPYSSLDSSRGKRSRSRSPVRRR